jgi:hypothetical protein
MLATTELRRRYHNHSAAFHITARRLAEFLQSVEAEEALLMQRLRDGESRTIRLGTPPSTEDGDAVNEQPAPSAPDISVARDMEDVGELYGEF